MFEVYVHRKARERVCAGRGTRKIRKSSVDVIDPVIVGLLIARTCVRNVRGQCTESLTVADLVQFLWFNVPKYLIG